MMATLPVRSGRLGREGPRLYVEEEPAERAAYWRINGYRAALYVWTVAEWESMAERPRDAQYHPSGLWCALRVD